MGERIKKETERLWKALLPGGMTFPVPDLTGILNPGQGAERPRVPGLPNKRSGKLVESTGEEYRV